MAKKQKPKKRKNAAWKTQAQQADKHELYEKSVQQPDAVLPVVGLLYPQVSYHPFLSLPDSYCHRGHHSQGEVLLAHHRHH